MLQTKGSLSQSAANYQLIESEKELEGQVYRCYGIQLSYAGAEVTMEDLSLDREKVERLVKLCNELALSPLHFRDVLEDFLGEESI